jgi:uncharacterized protein YfaS (alpha-2-macroglobulin family)
VHGERHWLPPCIEVLGLGAALRGGFGLWSSTSEAQPWLSAYAMDFLTRE